MTLAFAEACAGRLVKRLAPFCDRIEVAGSIRRARPTPGDVDLVAIPKQLEIRDLLGAASEVRNLAAIEIKKWAQSDGWRVEKDGPQYLVFHAKGVQVDIWWATPQTWGTVLMARTGSKEHNIALAMRALDRGGRWDPHHGLRLGGFLHAVTETVIYDALGLPFLFPETQRDAPIRWTK